MLCFFLRGRGQETRNPGKKHKKKDVPHLLKWTEGRFTRTFVPDGKTERARQKPSSVQSIK